MSTTEWRDRLAERMPPDLAEEIDIFEAQLELRRQDRVEERVFAETRSHSCISLSADMGVCHRCSKERDWEIVRRTRASIASRGTSSSKVRSTPIWWRW